MIAAALVLALAQQSTPTVALRENLVEPQTGYERYAEIADAKADIAAALTRATEENRRVLLIWGANWSGSCAKFEALEAFELNHERMYEYQRVYVDVGTRKLDKNVDLAKLYGAQLRVDDLPHLTVLDAQGTVLANQGSDTFRNPISLRYEVAQVIAFLTAHNATPWKAGEVLAAAKATAAKEQKRVFLTFGAPFEFDADYFDEWRATPQARALLAKDFVMLKLDCKRTVDGKELRTSLWPADVSHPWYCAMDPDGTVLASSVNAKGVNIGLPKTDEDIASFAAMLTKVRKNLTLEDIDKLQRSLVLLREQHHGWRKGGQG